MRRFDFIASEKFWAWTIAIGLALGAMLGLLFNKPITRFDYNAETVVGAVKDKIDYGVYPVEKDAGGQSFRWLTPQARFIYPVYSQKQPLTLVLRLRNASVAGGPSQTTEVIINDVSITTITPTNEFQDYTLKITPPYTDKYQLDLRLNTAPGWTPPGDKRKLGNMLQSVSIDASEVWSPVERPGRAALLWLLPLLALAITGLTIFANLKKEQNLAKLANYGVVLLSAGLAGLMLLWFVLLARVGYNGFANLQTFWLKVACAAWLALFFGWVALDGPAFGKPGAPSLWSWWRGKVAPLAIAHPGIAALLGLFVVNLAATGAFYAKIQLEDGSLDPIVRYWDGPEYLLIAHNFYDKNDALLRIDDFGQHSVNYPTAHFPGYPLALRLFWYLVGWKAAGPLINFLASTLFAFVLWRLLRDFNYSSRPFWLAAISLVLPLRWLIYHSVGGSEPLMMLFQLLSIYLFKKERYWLAGFSGMLALLVRPPTIFLWAGYLAFLGWEALSRMWKENKFDLNYFKWGAALKVSTIPLTLLIVFSIYAWRYGDFFAYFNIPEEVKHVKPYPFPALMAGQDVSPGFFYYYLLEAGGLVLLWKQARRDLFWIGLATMLYTGFLLHNDILRYSLPAFPLLIIIPYAALLSSKLAKWATIPVLLAIYFYSWGALDLNLMWTDNWNLMNNLLGK